MTKPKLLLLGGSGQMGLAVRSVFAEDYRLALPDSGQVDVLRPGILEGVLEKYSPDLVVYAVGYEPQGDGPEELEKAYQINLRFPLALAESLRERGGRLVTFSSDAVFPGRPQAEPPYIEDDRPEPDSLYALLKLGADARLTQTGAAVYNIRLSRLFGPSRARSQGPVNRLLADYLAGLDLKLINDVKKSLTYSLDAARTIRRLVEDQGPGLYHVANSGQASMFEFFSELARRLPAPGRLKQVTAAELGLAKKPKTTCLASIKIPPLRPWTEALHEFCIDYPGA